MVDFKRLPERGLGPLQVAGIVPGGASKRVDPGKLGIEPQRGFVFSRRFGPTLFVKLYEAKGRMSRRVIGVERDRSPCRPSRRKSSA